MLLAATSSAKIIIEAHNVLLYLLIFKQNRLWLKAVTEPNSAKHTAIAEWARTESTGNDGNIRFSDPGI